jgi:hypothetical protein
MFLNFSLTSIIFQVILGSSQHWLVVHDKAEAKCRQIKWSHLNAHFAKKLLFYIKIKLKIQFSLCGLY